MGPELRHLRYFVAVAEELSFTRAARRLHIAQPSLSAQIQELERQVGCQLLRRSTRHVVLTPAGETLLERARAVLAAADEALEATRQVSLKVSGTLTLRHGYDTGHVVAPLLQHFAQRHADVRLRAWEGSDAENLRALQAGEVDAIFSWPLSKSVPVHRRAVADVEIVAAVRADHPLSHAPVIPRDRLTQERVVMFMREHAPDVFDMLVGDLFGAPDRSRVNEDPLITTGQWDMLEAVRRGRGVTVVTAQAANAFATDGIILRPLDPPWTVAVELAWRQDVPCAPLHALIELINEQVRAP